MAPEGAIAATRLGAFIHRDSSPAAVAERIERRDARVHRFVPVGIVVTAIAGALTATVASVSEEHGANAQNVARQTLLHQQQLELEDTDAVDGDLHTFTQLEQATLMARANRKAARAASGARRQVLRDRALDQLRVARAVSGFEYQAYLRPAVNDDGTLRYDKHWFDRARRVAKDQDARLEDVPNLPEVRERASAERERGDTLVALAAGFAFAVLLFTLAANFKSGGAKVRWLAYGATALTLVVSVCVLVVLIPWHLD